MLKSTMFILTASVLVLIGKAFIHYTFEFPPKCFIFPTKMLGRPPPLPCPPPKKKIFIIWWLSANLPTLTHDFLKLFFHGLTTRLPISRFLGKYSEMKC